MIKLKARVINMVVRAKKERLVAEDGVVYEETRRIGRLTLEFDIGNGADVTEIAKLIRDREVFIGLSDTHTQLAMPLEGRG